MNAQQISLLLIEIKVCGMLKVVVVTTIYVVGIGEISV